MLLEAGPDYADERMIPADLLESRNLAGPDHDRRYTAIPVEGRTMPYQRGKVAGGSSAINAAAAQWARPADFDARERLGNSEDGDAHAVLNQRCGGRGADNLSVVDASVFPAVPCVGASLR